MKQSKKIILILLIFSLISLPNLFSQEEAAEQTKKSYSPSLVLLELAIANVRSGDYNKAEEFISQLVEKYPTSAYAAKAQNLQYYLTQKVKTLRAEQLGIFEFLNNAEGEIAKENYKAASLFFMQLQDEFPECEEALSLSDRLNFLFALQENRAPNVDELLSQIESGNLLYRRTKEALFLLLTYFKIQQPTHEQKKKCDEFLTKIIETDEKNPKDVGFAYFYLAEDFFKNSDFAKAYENYFKAYAHASGSGVQPYFLFKAFLCCAKTGNLQTAYQMCDILNRDFKQSFWFGQLYRFEVATLLLGDFEAQ